MRNYPLIGLNLIIFVLFISFLRWNSAPEEKDIEVTEVTVEKPKELEVSKADSSDFKDFQSELKDLENIYLKQEQQELKTQIKNLQKEQELLKLQEEEQLKLVLNVQKERTEKEKQEQEKKNLAQKAEADRLAKLDQEAFLKKVEEEVQKRLKDKEAKEKAQKEIVLKNQGTTPEAPSIILEKKDTKSEEQEEEIKIHKKATWDDLWVKIWPHGKSVEFKDLYADDLALEHKKLLEKANSEKIVDKVLWLHEKLSSSRKGLKSTMVKEVEMIKKEDDYSQTTDFLLSTGDRYIVLSLSIPLEPAPYEEGSTETFWVTAKVIDLDSEVLRFQLKLQNNKTSTREVLSYVPGDWVKILKSFK